MRGKAENNKIKRFFKSFEIIRGAFKVYGATAIISDQGSVNIQMKEDGTFELELPLEKPGYYSIRRNPLYPDTGG